MDLPTPKACGPLPSPAIYPDIPTAFAALQGHAKAHGYALFKRDSQPPKSEPTRVIYACDREGRGDSRAKNPSIHPKRQRKTGSKKCGCKMRVVVIKKDYKELEKR